MIDSTDGSLQNEIQSISAVADSDNQDHNRLSTADLCKALLSPCTLKQTFCRSHTSDTSIDFEKACSAIDMLSIQEKAEVQTSLEKAFEEPHVRLPCKSQSCRAKASEEVATSVPVLLAVALPLLEGALPRDEHGTCVIPHKHGLRQRKVRARRFTNAFGKLAYDTSRACDNCDEPIEERVFYSCAQGCEVDFCTKCHTKLQKLFDNVDKEKANWVVSLTEAIANFILQHMSGKQRSDFALCLASEWPQAMFERLVTSVVDVADALVVHVQDNSEDFVKSTQFWHIIGLLQVLYSANGLSVTSHQSMNRAFRVETGKFAVRGIDKCDAMAEYLRWRDMSSSLVVHTQALVTDSLEISREFASFLSHSNLVPISFRQRCLQHDVRHHEPHPQRSPKLTLGRAPREKAALLEFVVNAFGSSTQTSLAKELHVTFQGEPAAGPGVVREFLCVAMKSLLEPLDKLAPSSVGLTGTNESASSCNGEESASSPGTSSVSLTGTDASASSCSGENRAPSTGTSSSGSTGTDAAASPCNGKKRVPRSANDMNVTTQSSEEKATSVQGVTSAVTDTIDAKASSSGNKAHTAQSCQDKRCLAPVWEYDAQLHVYWFRNHCCSPSLVEEIYPMIHACGVLLGQAVHANCMLPAFFPQVLYAMLLHHVAPQCKKIAFTLADLGRICPEIAQSLDRLLEYEGDDLVELFRLDWPRGGELTSENREEHVKEYVQWFFSGRYATQLQPLSDGFRAVVGNSKLLQAGLVDASQLEQIICGAEMPVDVAAIQAGSTVEGWSSGDAQYLEDFWGVLQTFLESELRRFVLFVSSCSRAPPRGWQDLNLNVQRNGDGDDRLPTAFTCFNLLLLPRYTSRETLREKLLVAIAETEGFGLR